MKKILPFLILFQLTFNISGQNLVPNPSFEDTIGCPTTLADLSKTAYWTSPSWGSPDFFNTCSVSNTGVPNNIFGIQSAIDGNAYVGISVYDLYDTYSYREYIQVQLSQTLAPGQKYWISFYASLADSNDYAIKELGGYFSSTSLNVASDTTIMFIPQVEFNGAVITDKSNWNKISGSFVANGNENYITIGNFNRKQTTTALQVSNLNINYSYYYIDNVCVSSDSLTCNLPVGIKEIKSTTLFEIFPNPVNDCFTINHNMNETFDVTVYNSCGEKVHEEKNILSNSKTIYANSFNKGLLLINIKTRTQNFNYKLLKL